ncbi:MULTISPECIES: hypothetical protein [Spirosoma]|uniref:Uncharacterized protein n=1 Tax=Spirosoma sordidisoli TaxID=2502893 RepID=A0A4Q2USL4_9BACT|nr:MULTISPECIES: hypothetical protein [Spirosoma]RYC69819.1 hypothetical protein EQG79_14595 [Spirosoma sordidisoli]
MNTIELWIKGKARLFSGPSGWAELSEQQAIQMTRVRLSIQDHQERVFVALRVLYGMKPRDQRWLFDAAFLRRQGLSPEAIDLTLSIGGQLLDTLAWIGEPDARFPRRFRVYDFQFGTPRVWLGRLGNRQIFSGPAEALSDCTFEDFMFAEKAFRSNNRPLLAAVLCRPLGKGRPALDKDRVANYVSRFARLDPALLERFYFGFGSSLLVLKRHFPQVFDPPGGSSTNSGKPTSGSWLDVAINMAKLDVTKIRDIEQTNLYLALKVLNEQIRQADEMKQQLEAVKKR